MFEKKIETPEEFSSKVILLARVMSYGYLLIFIIFPLFVAATFLINEILPWIYMALFLGFSGFIFLLDRRIMGGKFDFWLNIETFDPLTYVFFFIIFGAIISAVLLWLSLPFLLGYPIFEGWETYVATIATFVSIIPIFYFANKYRRKKFKGERRRYVKGKRKEIEKTVIKALDSLNLKYNSVTEGSKWTMMIPSFHIEGYGISVKVYLIKYNEVAIAIKVEDPEYHTEARKIEKNIDSFLNIMSG